MAMEEFRPSPTYKISDVLRLMRKRRAEAMRADGTAGVQATRYPAPIVDISNNAAPNFRRRFHTYGARTTSALIAAITISVRSQFCVPIRGISITLNAIAPPIAPAVLAAYIPPTRR